MIAKKQIKGMDDMLLGGVLQKIRRQIRRRNSRSYANAHLDHDFIIRYAKNQNSIFSSLCETYGSDKGGISKDQPRPYPWPALTYADFYSMLFGPLRTNVKRVFECGIGTNNPNLASSMGANGKPGASLRVWRDFFPNAHIFGGDIDPNILFQEDRISSYYLDQTDGDSIKTFWEQVSHSDFDLIVDDGLHTFEAAISLFKNSHSKLSSQGIYIIEDVSPETWQRYIEYFGDLSTIDRHANFVTFKNPNRKFGSGGLVVILPN